MIEPSDFGLSPIATLSHVTVTTPAPGHSAFWARWRKAFDEVRPVLGPRPTAGRDPTDPTATHEFEGVHSTRIGCLLWEPPRGVPVRAGLVALHGYACDGPLAADEERWARLVLRGVAVLAVRVRGFPGSCLETGLLRGCEGGWIAHGLMEAAARGDDPLAGWVLPRAVMDVGHACLALAAHLRGRVPIFLQGESFGGGLAVITAAQLAGRLEIARLAIGWPSLGDWSWRLARPGPGVEPGAIGGQVAALMARAGSRGESLAGLLRLADASVHAPRVRGAVLAKLAVRDESVPAPTAAAVFNALGSDPGRKWRFVVPYGHFDGGLRPARRIALFERAREEFLDPARPVEESMKMWEPVMTGGDRPAPA
ncbi:MAG: acetylxylan esterase [Phycisphaerales bacterium]|nr:acetylxylan esterase [Phycisphaerales bacterium]